MSEDKKSRSPQAPSEPKKGRDDSFQEKGHKTNDSGGFRPANVDSVFHKPVVTKPPPKK